MRCERNLVLNLEKVRYKLREVIFMGCLLTDEGIKPDLKKVAAIIDMPMPTDVEAVCRLIGTVQYLGKFVKGLTNLTALLHELIRKESEFAWNKSHTKAVREIHDKLSNTPVLLYYDVSKDVTIQADASQAHAGRSADILCKQSHDGNRTKLGVLTRTHRGGPRVIHRDETSHVNQDA